MILPDLYRPIRNYGYLFIMVGACGILILFSMLRDVNYLYVVWGFLGSLSLFHLFVGWGLIVKSRRAFIVFLFYIKILYFAFPLGTYLSRQTMAYIEENNIERQLR